MKIYESNGQTFETLFTQIMERRSGTFRQVKPQGVWGDRKNDGFDHATGTYYQVFAPEDSWSSDAYGADKFKEDFEGLLKHWNQSGRVVQFFYVINDKFLGVGPKIHQEMESLRTSYPKVKIDLLPCSTLCDEFLKLNADHQDDVLGGPVPAPSEEDLDQGSLGAVIAYMLNDSQARVYVPIPVNVDFEKKLKFNKLSEHPATLLRARSLDARSEIAAYFKYRNKTEKQQLAEIFSAIYTSGKSKFAGVDAAEDFVFYYILNHVFPAKTKLQQDAVLALMAFFFESCDIFDAPPAG